MKAYAERPLFAEACIHGVEEDPGMVVTTSSTETPNMIRYRIDLTQARAQGFNSLARHDPLSA